MTKRNVRMYCVRGSIICTVTSSEKGEAPGGLLSKIGSINRPGVETLRACFSGPPSDEWNFL